jgi:mono/diheme cytochrome c family protein
MSKIKDKLNLLLYVFTILIAVFLVYRAFGIGFQKGEFEGKYYPPRDRRPPAEEKKPPNLRVLRISTPELVNEGRKLFRLNCASCHGDDGRGDGPKAAGLNPHPRNFVEEKFKNGASPLQIYNTLTTGIQGTSMPAFDLIPAEDRMALAHYVRTFVPNPPDDPPELVEELPEVEEDGTAVAATDSTTGDSTKAVNKTISIESAREQYIAQYAKSVKLALNGDKNETFERYCTSCHGSFGQGNLRAEHVVPTTVIYHDARLFDGKDGARMLDREEFGNFMINGAPGLNNHRFGFLTKAEIDELYNFIRELRR